MAYMFEVSEKYTVLKIFNGKDHPKLKRTIYNVVVGPFLAQVLRIQVLRNTVIDVFAS